MATTRIANLMKARNIKRCLIIITAAIAIIFVMLANLQKIRSVITDEEHSTENTTHGHTWVVNGLSDPFTETSAETNSEIDDSSTASIQNIEPNERLSNSSSKPIVLILTYMRSGSTFTADLLSQASGALLYYEPLHAFGNLQKENQTMKLTNGESKFFVKEQFPVVAEEVMEAYLSCQINHPYCSGYTDIFLRMHTPRFTKCIKTMLRNSAPCQEYLPCQTILKNECTSSKYIVMKTIRVPMYVVRQLFAAISNLRVVHLTRDARATIKSEMNHGLVKKLSVEQFISNFCQRVLNDIRSRIEIEKDFPGQILTIRYEDLALNPNKTTQKIYEFSGIHFTEEIEKYAWKITYTGQTCKGFLCTKRENATSAMLSWRKYILYDHVKLIDERCADVYHHLGYLPIKDEKVLRDLTKSLIVS